MKLLPKLLSLGFVLAMMALASCEEQQILFEGPDFVRFTDTTLTYKESLGAPVTVSVTAATSVVSATSSSTCRAWCESC